MTIAEPLAALTALAAVVATAALATTTKPASATATSLSPAETSALVYVREEEKLARDVYRALAGTWSIPVFSNIARSEQQHMNAVATLLDRYEIADPAAGKAAGQFTSPAFQKLYVSLVADGKRSLSAALAVGVRIEKLDISDLGKRLAAAKSADVRFLFTQLERGSQNHLRAFSR